MLIQTAYSQDISEFEAEFEGDWFGYIMNDKGDTSTYLKLRIEDDGGYFLPYSYSYNSENGNWDERSFDHEDFNIVRNNAVYQWMNSGGTWSESQTYHLSRINSDQLEMLWIRQVNNIKDGDNEVWFVRGSGKLKREEKGNTYTDVFVGGKSNQNILIDRVEVTDDFTAVTFTYNNGNDSGTSVRLFEPGTNGDF